MSILHFSATSYLLYIIIMKKCIQIFRTPDDEPNGLSLTQLFSEEFLFEKCECLRDEKNKQENSISFASCMRLQHPNVFFGSLCKFGRKIVK